MKWGLVLSGGGTRGSAHVGVLKALEENNLKPDVITGTSAGAIVAGLYASGCNVNSLERLIGVIDSKYIDIDYLGSLSALIRLLFNRNIFLTGFIKGNRLELILDKYCRYKSLTDVKMPFALTSVDINSSDLIVFTSDKKRFEKLPRIVPLDDVKVAHAIRASIAIPGLFKPKYIDGRRLVDGGVIDNVPVKLARVLGAHKIITVNLGYSGEYSKHVDNITEISMQALDILIWEVNKKNIQSSDLVLTPFVTNLRQAEMSSTGLSFKQGYLFTKKMIPEIKRVLNY